MASEPETLTALKSRQISEGLTTKINVPPISAVESSKLKSEKTVCTLFKAIIYLDSEGQVFFKERKRSVVI